tara:strand:- start:158 stop:778 length:621 start_codon:yes stop_codon:yes gene_type:complete
MPTGLTKRQSEVLELISNFIEKTGMPPTRAEIAKSLGFSSANAAEDHLRALARKNYIDLLPGTSRGIRLMEKSASLASGLELPVIGQVAAGQPILAIEHMEDSYFVDPSMFDLKPSYLLRVKGDSMVGIGILDQDLLVVHSNNVARNGQIVVARLDNEVTVKRFYKRGAKVRLLPENDSFKALEVDLASQELIIEGIGVGVLRAKV